MLNKISLDITFEKPFSSTPSVTATEYKIIEISVHHKITVYNVTPTGFTLWCYNDWANGDAVMYIMWIAVSRDI